MHLNKLITSYDISKSIAQHQSAILLLCFSKFFYSKIEKVFEVLQLSEQLTHVRRTGDIEFNDLHCLLLGTENDQSIDSTTYPCANIKFIYERIPGMTATIIISQPLSLFGYPNHITNLNGLNNSNDTVCLNDTNCSKNTSVTLFVTDDISSGIDNLRRNRVFNWILTDTDVQQSSVLYSSISSVMNTIYTCDSFNEFTGSLDKSNNKQYAIPDERLSTIEVLTLSIASFLRKSITTTDLRDVINNVHRVIGADVNWKINDPVYDIVSHRIGIVTVIDGNTSIVVQFTDGTTDKFELSQLRFQTTPTQYVNYNNHIETEKQFLSALIDSLTKNRIVKQYYIIDKYNNTN